WRLWNNGVPAGACHRAHSRDPLAGDDASVTGRLQPGLRLRMHPVDARMQRRPAEGLADSHPEVSTGCISAQGGSAMTKLATYSRSGPIGTITMDDGKANVMSLAMLNSLHTAFDEAEHDKVIPILKARGKHFSGGFDLSVFAKGSAEDQYLMVKAGA